LGCRIAISAAMINVSSPIYITTEEKWVHIVNPVPWHHKQQHSQTVNAGWQLH